MGLFDVYQVTDKSVFQGQECMNVYFFQAQSDVGTPDASDVSAAFIGQLLPLILDIQNGDVLHTEIRVANLFNPSDVDVAAISEAGTYSTSSDLLSIFNAVGFRLQQDNGAVKNGSKRYCGQDEGEVTDGVITDAGIGANLDLLADELAATLNHGIIPTFVPAIIKRLLIGGDYVLPDNLGDAVIGYVVEAVWDALITSQVSRKIGSGA